MGKGLQVRASLTTSFLCLAFALASTASVGLTAAPAGDYGTIGSIDASGAVSLVPWGKAVTDARQLLISADAPLLINLAPAKLSDLKPGMWIKVLEAADGKATKIIAGEFLTFEGDAVAVFKGMPEEFVVYRSDGWYTNTVAGVKFKVQPMGAGKAPSNPGTNLRAASYKEPAGGFIVYFPITLHDAVLGWGGAKPGAAIPDAEGRVRVNKETCTDYYWHHLRNPARPEAGYVSGMTEFTVRKLPARP